MLFVFMLLFVHFLLCTWIDSCCDIVRDQLLILCNIYMSKSNRPLALTHAFQRIYCRCILKSVNLLMNNDSIVFDVDWKLWSYHAFSKKLILFHCCNQHTMITTSNATMKSLSSPFNCKKIMKLHDCESICITKLSSSSTFILTNFLTNHICYFLSS